MSDDLKLSGWKKLPNPVNGPVLPEGTKSVWSPGVEGKSELGSGVEGTSTSGSGVKGKSTEGLGVEGESTKAPGVKGASVEQAGVAGYSDQFVGSWAETQSTFHPALFARGNPLAGRFEGDVEVTGDIRLLNADCAEDFDVQCADGTDPGTVMVVGTAGQLMPSEQSYDRRVAGVVSGAGDFKPALVLDAQKSTRPRRPIALVGKVFCKVDASYGAIEVGDLLTTSATPGHAMRANDPLSAFGAVIGKALRPLREGQGLIPILIALQ